MSTELAIYTPVRQEKGELEAYADQVADRVFVPLADMESWYVNLFEEYPCYWTALATELLERWADPPEE